MTVPTGGRSMGIDPRLRARRQDVARQQGRQRLRRAQASIAVVVSVGLGWAAAMSPLLDVDKVRVEGLDPVRADRVGQAVAIRRGSALATLDLDRVRAAAEAVPWVGVATVDRSWPGSVVISVTERRPLAAALLPDGDWVLVDAERQLAQVDEAELARLPRVVGALAEARPGAPLDDAARGALTLVVLLDDLVVPELDRDWPGAPEIVVGPDGALAVSLPSLSGDEAEVRLGRPVDLEEKVSAVAALLQSGVVEGTTRDGSALKEAPRSLSNRIVIDVRVPEAPVVSW